MPSDNKNGNERNSTSAISRAQGQGEPSEEVKPTMEAYTYNTRGPPSSVLKLSTLPKPQVSDLRPTQVLIKTSYIQLHALHAKVIMTKIPNLFSSTRYPELDFSGVVVGVGSQVSEEGRLKVGDRIFGTQDPGTHLWSGGVAREYLVLPAACVVKIPTIRHSDGTDDSSSQGSTTRLLAMDEAACLGGHSITILQFLDILKLQEGDRVLITGASGSFGSMVVPEVKNAVGRGGYVVGVCSGKNARMVKDVGADEVIDYTLLSQTNTTLSDHLLSSQPPQKFNAIIDIAGTDPSLQSNAIALLFAPSTSSSSTTTTTTVAASTTSDGNLHPQTRKSTFLLAGNLPQTANPTSTLFSLFSFVLLQRLKSLLPTYLGGNPTESINVIFHQGHINFKDLQRVASLYNAVAVATEGEEQEEGSNKKTRRRTRTRNPYGIDRTANRVKIVEWKDLVDAYESVVKGEGEWRGKRVLVKVSSDDGDGDGDGDDDDLDT